MTTHILQSTKLPEAEAGFRAVFEHSAIGIVLAGLDGLPRMVNPAIVRMTGYNEQELLSMPGLDLTYPEDRDLAVLPIRELLQGGRSTFQGENRFVRKNGEVYWVRQTISAIQDASELHGMVMIVFKDVAVPPIGKLSDKPAHGRGAAAKNAAELKKQLEYFRMEVQNVREEMQTSQEELQSTNEELQSTNEELQSTNEELTTSKEEMQSMNEELQTVNNELQAKLEELSHVNSDMKNLLDSTDIATLFLDNDLRVRRFTAQTSKITQLIPTDVGRPITDLASALLYPQLAEDAREVLRTLVKVDRQISLPSGDWFGVRILPYRTLENMIDGVVITFTDITESKKLEAELRKSNG